MDTPSLLENNLSPERREFLNRVSRLAVERHVPVYLAGGFVRDVLLGLPPDDFDFVVEGDAPALARALARKLGGKVTVHTPFRTAIWLGPDGTAIDFATARTETYARPAALPTVRPADMAADLHRRDFSINAMALRVDGEHRGELLDPFHGQPDLAARTVRVLHDRSFVDDPTRLFRAARYAGRLGFEIAPETLALIPGAWKSLAALTPDRTRHEFELIFREAETSVMLTRLVGLDILAHVHPALQWGERQIGLARSIPGLPWREWKMSTAPEPEVLYWALLLAEAAPASVAAALTRLNATREAGEAVRAAVALKIEGTQPSAAVAALNGMPEPAVVAAYLLHPDWRESLHHFLSEWRFVRSELSGDDLQALGLKPGPQFKRLLWALRAARLDGEVSDRAGELALVQKLAEKI